MVDVVTKEDNVVVRQDKLVSTSSPYESTPLTRSSIRSQQPGPPTLGGIGNTGGSHSGSYSLKSSYDIHTLPNTKAEACLWSGTSILTCDKYLSVKEGRLSQYVLVRNSLDSNPTNNLYTMVLALMMIHHPYKTDLNYYKIDIGKKEIILNDKLKVDHFPRLYNLHQCLYEHTIALYNHYSSAGLPYYHLYQVLAKGSDLEGEAKLMWQSQLNSATLSLVDDDIVNKILQSQIVQFFQMRDIMELIMDLIVYRVLLFDKLKTKQSVRTELKQKVLVSQHPGVHYDGILALVQKAVHYSKVFIGESSAVQDIVDTLVANVSQTSTNHLQLAMDLRSKLTTMIQTKKKEHRERLQEMDLNDETLLVFSWIEQLARDLQNEVKASMPSSSDRIPQPSYRTSSIPVGKSNTVSGFSSSSSYRPRSTQESSLQTHSSSNPRYKPASASIHSAQFRDSCNEEEYNKDADNIYLNKSHFTPIDERPDIVYNLEEIHTKAKNADMRSFMMQDDYAILPDNVVEFKSKFSEGRTVHVREYSMQAEGLRLIDTLCTVEPPFQGLCSLCGKRNHDFEHCRLRAQGKGPNGEAMVNLANFVWFPDQVLEEQLAFARKDGFLKGVTEAEMKWVRRKIADLKEERKLTMKERFQPRPRSPGVYGPASSPSL